MLKEFKNWTEISAGYYRYVISSNVAYEIIVEYWDRVTPIETAKASLCLVGKWRNKDGSNTLEREWLSKELPICELLKIAHKDDVENNK